MEPKFHQLFEWPPVSPHRERTDLHRQQKVKAFLITNPGATALDDREKPVPEAEEVLLRTRYIGLCGTDLNTFRGKNPMVTYPRIPGHEVAATIVEGSNDPHLVPGTHVTMSPYTSCGQCASCRRQRPNACQFNQTL